MTLWGECEQAACILAILERMRYQNVSEVVGGLWWCSVGTSLAGPIALIDSHGG